MRAAAAWLTLLRDALLPCTLLSGALTISGCHSAFVQTTVTNLGAPIRTFELDYPSQSFGTSLLGTGQVFRYRFKVQGSGPVKVQFYDHAGKIYSATGPNLNQGVEGTLGVVIDRNEKVSWQPKLTSRP